SSWLDRLRMPRLALGPDGVLIDMLLVEQPLGDPFVNEEIWGCTDEQATGMERKALLVDNGFRVGQVVGLSPAKLQNLLSSERHGVGRGGKSRAGGGSPRVTLGASQPECSFRIKTESGSGDVTLAQGQCTLLIEPALTADGRIRL